MSTKPKLRRPKPVCDVAGKHAYNTRKLALTMLHRVIAHGSAPTMPTGIYKCPHCRAYHLTSQHNGRA